MSNSYDQHHDNVEQARKSNGEFGPYNAGHSEVSLSGVGNDETLNAAIDDLKDTLPADIPVSRSTNTFGESNVDVGKIREDEQYPMNVYGDGEGNYTLHAPLPGEGSHNVHDAVSTISTDDSQELAVHAADFYRDNVVHAGSPPDPNRDKYGQFREVDRRPIQPGYDNGWDESSDRAAVVVAEHGITGYSRIGEPVTEELSFGRSQFTPHRVTLQNADRQEVEFPHFRGSAYGDEPPTAAETIGSVADDARSIEDYPTLDEFAQEAVGVDPVDKFDEPEAWEQVKRDYENIHDNAERLKSFVGEEAYEKLLWGDE